MTDDDVLTAVRDCLINARDSVAGEQMATSAGDIITRVRRRRLRYGLAAAAAVVAAVTALTVLPGSGSHGGGKAPPRSGWRPGPFPSGLAAGSGSPSAICATRPACSASCAPMASRPRSGSPARSRARACTTRSLPVILSGCWTGSSCRTARPAARPCSPSTPRPSPLRSGSGSTSARPAPSPDGTAAAAPGSPPAGLSSTPAAAVPPVLRPGAHPAAAVPATAAKAPSAGLVTDPGRHRAPDHMDCPFSGERSPRAATLPAPGTPTATAGKPSLTRH